MIDIKDLRIGNILTHEGEIVYVSSLSLDIDDEYEETIGFCKWGTHANEKAGWNRELADTLLPVPLTPEWLERCGLSFYEHDNELFPMVAMKHNGQVVAVFTKTAPCEYVHQLQNLYHALTGTELQIKSPQ